MNKTVTEQHITINQNLEKDMIRFLEQGAAGLVLVGRVRKGKMLFTSMMFSNAIPPEGQKEIFDVIQKYIA